MIEDERLKTDSLHNQIKLLENDDYEVEKIAREKYGMVKPGEKVFFKSQIDSVKK
jgi:cell division protein FtsB